MIRNLLFLSLLFQISLLKAQFYKIHGQVNNSAMEALAFVNVAVIDHPALITKTDISGHYELMIPEGSYVLVFSLKGFKSLKLPVTVNYEDVEQNVVLEPETTDFGGYKVSAKKIDRSEEIIRHVIDGKYRYMYQAPYSVDAYIKASESQSKIKKDSNQNKNGDLNLAEVNLTVHFSPPNKIKEERAGVEIRGEKSGLFFLSHTDGDFDFYKNLLYIPALSESPILSPVSSSGLIAYKFKMLSTYYENGIKYYRIKVSPSLLGNALVSGELVVRDSLWCIQSLNLSIPKYHMAEYDYFDVSQTFETGDSGVHLKTMSFNYEAKFGKSKSSGRTVVYYSNFKLNKSFKKRFFNNEISSTGIEAYERDSTYWQQIRKEPLSRDEIVFLRKSDSIRAVQAQKTWQDSADRVFNKLTLIKLFFKGQGNYKRAELRTWEFKPLAFVYTPVYIAGPRFSYWVSYEKVLKNKKEVHFAPSLNYGTLNQDLKGSVGFAKLYNPFNRGFYNISVGSDFGVINPYNSWIRTFARSNFYENDFINFFHRIELLNGFYVGTGVEFADRRSIAHMKFDKNGDDLWGGNTDLTAFENYQAFYGSLNLYYIPFQKYIREPYQKLILGSKWPEFSVRYRKGLPIWGSQINFDYLEFVAEQELKIGLLGVSKFRVVSGEFLNTKDLRLVDYKFQRSIGPFFFANPLYSFQGIDSSFATVKRFYEGHYFHRFNGAILNKVPLLKKLNLSECAGGGLLYTTERDLRYIEMYVGLEKIIRLWKERIRVGVFYVGAYSNRFSVRPEFKLTIEVYDKLRNRWPY